MLRRLCAWGFALLAGLFLGGAFRFFSGGRFRGFRLFGPLLSSLDFFDDLVGHKGGDHELASDEATGVHADLSAHEAE